MSDTPEPLTPEAPCSVCGSDWHYTDEHATADLPPGAYLASALAAARIPTDSGEDVDRLIGELARRGWTLTRTAGVGSGLDVERLTWALVRVAGTWLPRESIDTLAPLLAAAYAAITQHTEDPR